ncbi:MAG: prephenate dehydrogenase [Clostridia bacterium]|nr:prephenate dehydrogenase [Clostridia bacterium]
MKIGIIGLGLIGGSMARAYKTKGHTVYAYDKNEETLDYAVISGIADARLQTHHLKTLDILFIALYPKATINYLEENSRFFGKDCTVIDLCGTKRNVCEKGFRKAEEYGFTFIGGHPMAGTHFSGIQHSRSDMFKGAPMVLVPPVFDNKELINDIKKLLAPAGFGMFSVTTAEEHDKMIAFTSQMAHLVSNAYIKSETAKSHNGFSAGSYKDMTRVAWLNENMWTELFLENADCLIHELDLITASLNEYKKALEENDEKTLCRLLRDGRIAKEEIDGK